jgi:hypothetical protein
MRTSARIFALLAPLAVLAAASPTSPSASSLTTDAATSAASVDRYISYGDLLTANGHFEAGRDEYAVAADLVRADGGLPVESVRRIANAYFFEGDYLRAEAVLLNLVEEAATFGDGEAQIWALADATWLASFADSEGAVRHHSARLEDMLDRHDLPQVQHKIRSGLLKNLTVFAPHLASW